MLSCDVCGLQLQAPRDELRPLALEVGKVLASFRLLLAPPSIQSRRLSCECFLCLTVLRKCIFLLIIVQSPAVGCGARRA